MCIIDVIDYGVSLFSDFFTRYPGVFSRDLLRYALGAGGVYLIVNVLLSRALARRKLRDAPPQPGQIRREIAASLRTVFIFAAFGTLIGIAAQAGLVPIYTDVAEYGLVWLFASMAILVVAHDAWFYWTHRIMHWRRAFRWFHRLHHKSHNPTPFTSYSFDASEAVVNAVFFPLALLIVPSHPIALLFFTVHMMLRNAIGHCGYEVFPSRSDGRPLVGWMTTVTHHDIHHQAGGYNFGFYFTWWDRWMGTEHPEYLSRFAAVAKPLRHGRAILLLLLNFAIAGGAVAAVAFSPAPDAAPDALAALIRAPG